MTTLSPEEISNIKLVGGITLIAMQMIIVNSWVLSCRSCRPGRIALSGSSSAPMFLHAFVEASINWYLHAMLVGDFLYR